MGIDDLMSSSKQWYQNYLTSDHWRELREAKLLEKDFRCERCRNRSNLQVHHKNYSSVGRERLTDLEVLCDQCHQLHHDTENSGFDPINLPAKSIEGRTPLILSILRKERLSLVSSMKNSFGAGRKRFLRAISEIDSRIRKLNQ